MRKNIFIVSKGDIVYGKTAAATRMKNYAKALSDNCFVYMISFDKLTKSSKFKETEKNIFAIQENDKKSIKIYDLISTIKSIIKFNKLYNGITGDKFIIYYPNTNTIFFDVILLLLYRKSLFAEINEVRKYSSESQSGIVNRVRLYLYSLIYESTFKFYRGLIFISKNIKQFYQKENKNSVIIPILSDINNGNQLFNNNLKEDNEVAFVFTGTISFAKENLEELIRGFNMFIEKHNNAKLLFYGSINIKNKTKLSILLTELDLCDKVVYKGNLERNEVQAILEDSDCLLLPRRNNKQNYFGFSTKLAEYAISGTPIIMTNTGVISDYFEDKENCLLCEGYERDDFNEKFLEFISLNEKEKNRIAGNALATAKIHFDYRNYSSILNGFIQ